MPLSQTEYLWSGATPLLLISPARFFLYKGPKIDYFLRPPLDYRLLFALVSSTPSGTSLVGTSETVWGAIKGVVNIFVHHTLHTTPTAVQRLVPGGCSSIASYSRV